MTRSAPSSPFRAARSVGQVTLLAAFLVLLGGAEPLLGQLRPTVGTAQAGSSGASFWVGLAVGGGGTRLTCDFCQSSRDLGPFVTLSAGSRASSGMRVGVELGGWTHDDDGVQETVYRAGVVAHLTPLVGRGLYLIGGFGWSGYRAEAYRYDAPRLSVGAGWDLPFLPGWVIGNELVLDAASLGSLRNDDITVARQVGLSTVRLSIHLRQR